MTRIKSKPKKHRIEALKNGALKVTKKGSGGVQPVPAKAAADKKKHRWRNGTVAMREIKNQQKSTRLLLRKFPFYRVVREVLAPIADELCGTPGIRISKEAVLNLQIASEDFLIEFFRDVNLLAIHAGRSTIDERDFSMVMQIKGDYSTYAKVLSAPKPQSMATKVLPSRKARTAVDMITSVSKTVALQHLSRGLARLATTTKPQ